MTKFDYLLLKIRQANDEARAALDKSQTYQVIMDEMTYREGNAENDATDDII
jgi:hypothetical protein